MNFEEGLKEIHRILEDSGFKETILHIDADGKPIEAALIFDPKREDAVESFKELIKEPSIMSPYYREEGAHLSDNVNSPKHYSTGRFECIEVMEEALGTEAVKGFCLCNAFKYIYRCRNKNGLEDIKKADWYLKKLIEIGERENENNT